MGCLCGWGCVFGGVCQKMNFSRKISKSWFIEKMNQNAFLPKKKKKKKCILCEKFEVVAQTTNFLFSPEIQSLGGKVHFISFCNWLRENWARMRQSLFTEQLCGSVKFDLAVSQNCIVDEEDEMWSLPLRWTLKTWFAS